MVLTAIVVTILVTVETAIVVVDKQSVVLVPVAPLKQIILISLIEFS